MKLKKITIILFFIFILIMLGTTVSNASLELYKLEFDVKLNNDGSMEVTEHWNISISDTNTLFKTFEIDKEKYGGITNVRVKDVTNSPKVLNRIDEEMYHVTKDCYYALKNSKGLYEIAWGVSIEDKETRKYEISYKVDDAIKVYNDCAELYWQFIGSDFEIPANNVIGKITLPQQVEKEENLRIWAHGQLNGTIEKENLKTIGFQVKDFNPGKYVEIRITTPTEIFNLSTNKRNENKLNQILLEEQKWADEANRQREIAKIVNRIIIIGAIAVQVLIIALIIKSIKKNMQILKQSKKIVPEQKMEYYRDIPNKEQTPAEAAFIYYPKSKFKNAIPKVVSATMLNLCLKKYVIFERDETTKNKEIKVKILEKTNQNELKKDEKIVYDFLSKVKEEKTFTMKELEKYIKKSPTSFLNKLDKIAKEAENQQVQELNYNKEMEEKGTKHQSISTLNMFLVIGAIFGMIFAFIDWILVLATLTLVIVAFINSIINNKITKIFNGFTQKGVNEKEKLQGLKRYMENFSMIDNKEVPELVLWEKYLVYATTFGIADKVLKQLKIKYPEIESSEYLANSAYMYVLYGNGFNNNFIDSINTSINRGYSSAIASTSASSGTGGGGGFSIGGGRRPAVAEVGGRQISTQ